MIECSVVSCVCLSVACACALHTQGWSYVVTFVQILRLEVKQETLARQPGLYRDTFKMTMSLVCTQNCLALTRQCNLMLELTIPE